MRNYPEKLICHLLLSILLLTTAVAQVRESEDIKAIDYQNLVSRADVTYDVPVSRSEEGLPVGNGVMGSLVWTSSTALHLQLNRVDVFANNSASNNFYERHTDYCGGVGLVDIEAVSGIDPVFTAPGFQQHLSCYEGIVSVKGKGISAKTTAWQEQDVMAVHLEDARENPSPLLINLRSLRPPVSRKGDHLAATSVKVIGNRILLTQEFKEGNYYCGSTVIIEAIGREVSANVENAATARIITASENHPLTIFMASSASFDPAEDLVATATKKLEAAKIKGFDGILRDNQVWWTNFWSKSLVQLHSEDGVADNIEKHYNYYRYVMASSSRGKYPTKFNGMLWTTGGDERKWGNLFWGANQSCLYNALFQTNNLELLHPMFNMYSSAYDSFSRAAQQQWGTKGIFIPETVAFDGLAPLPEDIAAEMRDLYLVNKPWKDRSENFINYSQTKMPFLSRWNWKKDDGWKDGIWKTSDKGGGTFGHVTHIFSRGAKIAYQYWLYYEYTQDIEWLRSRAYPMIRGVAEFYRNFPNVNKEKDGKYHIYHVNDNESVWGGHNTVEEIASMMGIVPVAIQAAEILNIDADLRKSWKEFATSMAPLPLSTDYNKANSRGDTTWIRSLLPIVQGNGDRVPDPNTMPIWFFDLCTLESPQEIQDLGNATFDTYFPSGIGEKTRVNVLSKLPATGSLLGRIESTRYLIPNQIETLEIEALSNRMDLREGNQTLSIQRLGRAAEALQYALCQSIPARPGDAHVIRIFPAWPAEWDAQFTLLCRGGFMVSASMKKEKVAFAEIISQAGQECRIRNPWPGKVVIMYRNGKRWKEYKQDLILFQTVKGDRFVMLEK